MTVRLIAALLLAAAVGCGPEPAGVMDAETFIQVVADLRSASQDSEDSTVFDIRREEILSRAGVTDSMLEAFTRRHGSDVTFMASVWDSIDAVVNANLVDDLTGPDTVHVP